MKGTLLGVFILLSIFYITLFTFPFLSIITITIYLTGSFVLTIHQIIFVLNTNFNTLSYYSKRFDDPIFYVSIVEIMTILLMFLLSNHFISFGILASLIFIRELLLTITYFKTRRNSK